MSNSISYSLSGETSLVLAIRALNKDKRVIVSSGSSSSIPFLGQGKNVDGQYQGEVAFAEVILVKKSKSLSYPFKLKNPGPKHEKAYSRKSVDPKSYTLKQFDLNFAKKSPPVVKEENSWLGKPNGVFVISPILIELFGVQVLSFWGISTTVKVTVPLIPSVDSNLSAIKIVWKEVVDGNGESNSINSENSVRLKRPGGYFMNGVYVPDDEKKYLQGQTNITIPYKKKSVSKLKGTFVLQFPKEMKELDFSPFSLGKKVSRGGMDVRVSEVSERSAVLELEGDVDRIVDIQFFNKKKDLISTSINDFKKNKEGKWETAVGFHGTPHGIIIVVASEMESREYDLVIPISGVN